MNNLERQPLAAGTDQGLPLAMALHRKGRLAEAEAMYRAVLEKRPDDPDALHYLGVVLHQTGRSAEAVASVERAIALRPGDLDARRDLGKICRQMGDLPKAAEAYRGVVALAPEHAGAHGHLGRIYKELGYLEWAVDAYRRVIELDPAGAGAYNNLGAVLGGLERYEEATEVLLKAAELAPYDADVLCNLGNVLLADKKWRKAAYAYRKAIALNPSQPPTVYESLWAALRKTGQAGGAEAKQVLRLWVQNDPDNPVPRHHYSACSGGEVPDRASDGYVRQVFDKFSESFDKVLNDLEYSAPEQIAGAVAALVPAPAGDLQVLDAGCGTGLCGKLMRPYAARLTGVDLSAGMLAKATERALYDNLLEAEVVDYMRLHAASFDLIVSADTLIYFGDLLPFFRAAANALKPAGYLVVTMEACEEPSDRGFKLHHHGRYAHSAEYVKRTLASAGLALHSTEAVVLRKEGGQPVAGMLVTATLAKG
jgi:predicted TPR repeat methyltransferase